MAALERFLEPPRLRTIEDEEEERRSTWLELFFDLVFVVAVAQLGQNLSDDPSFAGFLRYVALFIPVWWAWMGFTFYADRFDTDDLVYRLLTLAGMLAVAAMSVNVRDAFEDGWSAFVASYALQRSVLLLLYARAWRHAVEARRLTTIYLAMFSFGLALWIVSAFLGSPQRYAVWGIALAVELSAPLFGWRAITGAPVHPSHLPERFGLFTIIVLGEAVLAVVLGTTKATWETEAALVAALGFVVAASLWWLHFDFLDTSLLSRGLAGLSYVFGHFPLVLGIAAFGVGMKQAILETPEGSLSASARWILGIGLALTLLAMGAIQLAGARSLWDPDLWLRAGSGLAVLAAAAFVSSPVALVALLATVLVVQVAVEIAEHEAHATPAGPL
jgi:low temperature requirement protein LtrA